MALSSWMYVVCPLCCSCMGIPRDELPELAVEEAEGGEVV